MAKPTGWNPNLVGNLVGGMDAGLDPDLIQPGQFSYGRNISVRQGRVHSRPRLVPRYQLPSGKIQGAEAFQARDVMLVAIAGHIYEVDPFSWNFLEKTSNTDYNNPNRPRMYFCETVGSIAIQDDQSAPIIYDGSTWRRSNFDDPTTPELPVGAMMSYSNGRLCVAVDQRNAVRIGDIKQQNVHQSEFQFTETLFYAGGGDISFPQKVTSLSSLPVINTATGQGSTIVGCRGRVHSLNTQITAREQWDSIPFATEVFTETGITGHRATAQVNQDLYFRANDGLRSIRTAVGDYAGPGLTPLSREVAYRLDHDSGDMLEDAIVRKFDNRLLVTHSPIRYGNRSIALGLISYNLDPLSTGGRKQPAVFDGEWDGVQIAEIVVGLFRGQERCFVIGRDQTGANWIWELLSESNSVVGVTESPQQELVTGALPGAGINAFKELKGCDIWLSDIAGPVDLKVYYRTDQYPYWIYWDEFNIPAAPVSGWTNNAPVFRNPLSCRTPPEYFDPKTGQYSHRGFSFQIRLVWSGQAKVKFVEGWSAAIPQPDVADNTENEDQNMYAQVPEGQESPSFWYNFPVSPVP
jgi:hypothetical protein